LYPIDRLKRAASNGIHPMTGHGLDHVRPQNAAVQFPGPSSSSAQPGVVFQDVDGISLRRHRGIGSQRRKIVSVVALISRDESWEAGWCPDGLSGNLLAEIPGPG